VQLVHVSAANAVSQYSHRGQWSKCGQRAQRGQRDQHVASPHMRKGWPIPEHPFPAAVSGPASRLLIMSDGATLVCCGPCDVAGVRGLPVFRIGAVSLSNSNFVAVVEDVGRCCALDAALILARQATLVVATLLVAGGGDADGPKAAE
jgi:hypothetical protein